MTKKILVIKLGALGDFVSAVGKMKKIRQDNPHAHITLMTMQPFVKIGQQSGFFDAVVIDNRSRYNPVEWYRVCKHILTDGHYDIIYDLQASLRTRKKYYPAARFLGHGLQWAFQKPNGFFVKTVAPKRAFCWGKATQKFVPFHGLPPDLTFCDGGGKNFHLLPKKYVLIIPGCSPNHPYKRWPIASYVALVQKLAAKGVRCVVLGTNAEAKEVNTIAAADKSAVNFLNKASLLDIPKLAHRASVVVGNDTGPIHIAALSRVPVICLFCAKTQASARHQANITNFVGQNIADITPETVFNQVMRSI